MNETNGPIPDQDLTLRFHWRWGEHGIYLGVCVILGLLVLGLYAMPRAPKRQPGPKVVELIQVRYLTVADEVSENADPFHDTRLIRRPRTQVRERPLRPSM
jgi:hypothetical protein